MAFGSRTNGRLMASPRAADPGELFRNHLQRCGLHRTAQRERVLEVFLDMGGHPTPEELYEEIGSRGGGVGLATVYRTLKLLLEAGVAERRLFGDGLDRYEPRCGKGRHVHLVCEVCGRKTEIPMGNAERLFAKMAREHAFVLRHSETSFYGLCDSCARALARGAGQVARAAEGVRA